MLYMSEMSETRLTFGDHLRQEIAIAQARQAELVHRALALDEMERAEAEANRQRSEAMQPHVYGQLLADARAFALVMAEHGRAPTHSLRTVIGEPDPDRRMGLGTDSTVLQTPVWAVSEQRMGGWLASNVTYGTRKYMYEAQITGLAVDAEGQLWNYSQHQRYDAGVRDSAPGPIPPLYLRGILDSVGRAGIDQVAPIEDISPYVDTIDEQPVVQQFRASLVNLATQP